MARSGKKARRLVVGGEVFLVSLGHEHREEAGRYLDCTEVLTIRRHKARGRLRIAFRQGPGRLVPDGGPGPGTVVATENGRLNLAEPGTMRALLDEATARGWQPDDPHTAQIDGWTLFDPVAAHRNRNPHA